MNSMNVKAVNEVQDLVKGMLQMANRAQDACESDCCLLVYCVVKDCTYKIRSIVEQETLCEANKKRA